MGLETQRGRIFPFTVPALEQNAYYVIVPDEQNGAARKFKLNVCNIFNDSDETIKVEFNDGAQIVRVSPQNSKAVSGVLYRNAKVTNLSSTTTTADEVSLEFQSEIITADRFFEMLSDKPIIRNIFRLPNGGG